MQLLAWSGVGVLVLGVLKLIQVRLSPPKDVVGSYLEDYQSSLRLHYRRRNLDEN